MVWSIFVWTVLPTGASLVVMLASGKSAAMWTASKVLSTPVRMGEMHFSLASVMTAVCLLLTTLSHSGLRRCEARAAASSRPESYDQQMRDVFHQGRNLYLSMLGLTLWALAWRLRVLHEAQQLTTSRPHTGARRSWFARSVYLILGLTALVIADVPLCRINYNLQLYSFVTPKKGKLLAMSRPCEGIMHSTAGGECADFCTQVRHLSEERLAAIKWARNWHILGRIAAEIFDESRGVEQGTGRIDALFAKKTCLEVLRSVDKSNEAVNYFCLTVAVLSFMFAFAALTSVFDEHPDNHTHVD
uniref:Uncharacterized protein n=1 Tax=Pyrodinium bahamense TaxID=73915 RepID=A0A7S0AAK8_9DINO|mmetsp:Transcript_27995/g.76980  ORF Transcript_27995/g.76980 Transcript_27995/m.76980 type:complete len:302 (+) Transcript_27995:80-985(+)